MSCIKKFTVDLFKSLLSIPGKKLCWIPQVNENKLYIDMFNNLDPSLIAIVIRRYAHIGM
jgi:hypothetical protein